MHQQNRDIHAVSDKNAADIFGAPNATNPGIIIHQRIIGHTFSTRHPAGDKNPYRRRAQCQITVPIVFHGMSLDVSGQYPRTASAG